MTCTLDSDCLGPADPYKGLGCNAGGQGQYCRFCGFSSDGTQYPPCVEPVVEGISALAKAGPPSSCPKACLQALGLYCPKVCGGKTSEGDDMTCALDVGCLDPMSDPYGGLGCGAGSQGQHCRFCGFSSDGIEYPPCAGSKLDTSALVQATSNVGGAPAQSLLAVLLGVGLFASVGAAIALALGFAPRRGGIKSELLSTTEDAAGGSWEPAKVSAESDYARFGE